MSERRTPRPVPCFSWRSSTRTSHVAAPTSATAASSVSASPTISIRPGSTSDSNSRSRISGESSINKTRSGVKLFTYIAPIGIAAFRRLPSEKGTSVKRALLSALVLHFHCRAPSLFDQLFFLFDQSVFDCIVGQVGVRLHRHFFQDARSIRADRFHRKIQ